MQPIIHAVQTFHQIVDAREIHRCINLAQQAILRHQYVHTLHLDCLLLFSPLLQHLHHLFP